LERMELNGRTLGAVGYGIFATLTIQCLDIMINKPRPGQRRWMLPYVLLLFTLGTLTFAGEAKYSQTTWVDERNGPGGPDALIGKDVTPVRRMAVVSCLIGLWVADALLLYRCFVVWSTSRFVYLVMALPVCTYILAIVSGILVLVKIWKSPTFLQAISNVTYSSSVALNVLVTLLIVWRLMDTRRTLKQALGAEHAKAYTSIAAMLIESAALYSGVGIIRIVAYARKSDVQNLVLPCLEAAQGIAPMLIILRVVQGREWSNGLTTTSASYPANPIAPTTIAFSPHKGGTSFSNDQSHTSITEKV